MSEHAGLWEQLTEHGIERLRLRKQKGAGTRVTAAQPDGDWLEIATLLPQTPAWLAITLERFQAGGHERLDLINLKEPQLRMVCAVHDTTDGPGAGGLRRHDPVTDPLFVIEDTLNLARSM
ncbi:MAG TPA: hypothetical protein PKA37_11655, partial [Planctomycetota bacterium]|nr:hypothetical protein [Planctomycetota bacterium]